MHYRKKVKEIKEINLGSFSTYLNSFLVQDFCVKPGAISSLWFRKLIKNEAVILLSMCLFHLTAGYGIILQCNMDCSFKNTLNLRFLSNSVILLLLSAIQQQRQDFCLVSGSTLRLKDITAVHSKVLLLKGWTFFTLILSSWSECQSGLFQISHLLHFRKSLYVKPRTKLSIVSSLSSKICFDSFQREKPSKFYFIFREFKGALIRGLCLTTTLSLSHAKNGIQ